MYSDNGYFPASPALRRAAAASSTLRKRGATVESFTPPAATEGVRIFLGLASADGGKDLKRLLGNEKPIPQITGLLRAMGSLPVISPIVATIMEARGQRHLARIIRNVGACSTEKYWGRW